MWIVWVYALSTVAADGKLIGSKFVENWLPTAERGRAAYGTYLEPAHPLEGVSRIKVK